MEIYNILDRKIGGGELSEGEIRAFVRGVTRGEVLAEQIGAFLAAVRINGMTSEETLALTLAMRDSGKVITLDAAGVTVDKHSSGGVGDTVTLVAAPIMAAAGLTVAKLSGRGLGHTGGTVDKLESFKGFNTELSISEFSHLLKSGIVVAGQSGELVPADKILYAMRDRTATVSSIPLITASIMSKKLASGADILVFDIKYGNGAFMQTVEDAKALAAEIVRVARLAGKKSAAVVSSMEQPLSAYLGCNHEVNEAIRVLKGKDCPLKELSLAVSRLALRLAGKDENLANEALSSGSAYKKLVQLITAQGGEFSDHLPINEEKTEVLAEANGYISKIDTTKIGMIVQELNRADKSSGVEMCARIGDKISRGEPLAILYGGASHKHQLQSAFTIGQRVSPPRLIAETII